MSKRTALFKQLHIHMNRYMYKEHGKRVVFEGVNNTAVASLDDDVTMAWKEDVVRGSLFWLAQPLRNFSAQQQPSVRLGKETLPLYLWPVQWKNAAMLP